MCTIWDDTRHHSIGGQRHVSKWRTMAITAFESLIEEQGPVIDMFTIVQYWKVQFVIRRFLCFDIAQNGYCSRDIYLQFEMFARSVILRVIIQKRSGRT